MALIRSFLGATLPGSSFFLNKTFLRIALVTVVTLVLSLMGYLMYQNHLKKEQLAKDNAVKVEVQAQQIETITVVAKDNAIDAETAQKAGELTMSVTLDTTKIKEEDKKKTTTIIAKKQDKDKKIKEEFESSPKSQADVKAAEVKTAENQVDSMWAAFCLHSGDKSQCNANT